MDGDESVATWAERAKKSLVSKKKKEKMLSRRNKTLYNFGIMHDFFNYSAMSIQRSRAEIDLTGSASQTSAVFAQIPGNDGGVKQNIFAIAKVGLPNLIFPSCLDLKISNYNQYSSYIHLSDQFFPDLSKG